MKPFFLVVIVIFSCFAQAQTPLKGSNRRPFVLGVTEDIYSKVLSEQRTINIYLPEGYKDNDTTHYPVVYLLDGSADEDFIHITGLYQYNNFPWIDRVPKSIIVGIANVDRKRDFTFPTTIAADKKNFPTTGGSARFTQFIEQELQPYITKNYRTTGANTIIGESLGGLLATEILFKKPSLFERYIIVSPSLWWDNASLLNLQPEIAKPGFTNPVRVYIGVGKEGLTPGKSPRVMEVDANMLADKIKKTGKENVEVFFDYLQEEDHATVTHQAVFNALRTLYPSRK